MRCRSRHSRDAVTNTQYSATAIDLCVNGDGPVCAAVATAPQVGLRGAGHPAGTVRLVAAGAYLVVGSLLALMGSPPGGRECGAAGPGKWAAGCFPLPLRAPGAAAEAHCQGISGERSWASAAAPTGAPKMFACPLIVSAAVRSSGPAAPSRRRRVRSGAWPARP
jgi:hypothetical protein